ncbi:MAG: AsmA family protein [Planctomycetota bacterium]|nr:AsmA family protein [Planctomycetota bacterium]
MKWVFRIFVVVVLLFILALLFLPGTIARPIAERVASNKMKVDVGIGGLSASVFSSSVGLSGLDVGNPEGFDSDKMMSVKEIKAQANIMSFLTSVIEIPSVNLDGLDMLIENKGFKNNVKTLMNNLKGEGGEGDAESSGEGKKFKIDKIVITNAKVTFKTGVVPAASVTIDELVVEDIGHFRGHGS